MNNLEPIKELRVHGVSGTPPRDILYSDPVPRLESTGYARVFQRRPSQSITHPDGRQYRTEAFHWGSLTTGHWLTSLWILLAPFAFANVAGWMAHNRSPARRSVIRIACLALTGLFVAQIGYVVVGVPVAFASGQTWATETSLRWVHGGLGLTYVLVFGAVVLRLSAQSHFEPLTYQNRFSLLFSPVVSAMTPPSRAADWSDPAAARVTDSVMWDLHSIVHRLRRIHFAGGLFVIALSLGRTMANHLIINLALIGFAVAVTALLLTTHRPEGSAGLWIAAWLPLAAETLALSTVLGLALTDKVLDLTAIHRTTFEIAIALGVAGALAVVAGLPSLGALTFGTLFGGALGVGVGFVAEDMLSVEGQLVAQGGAWVAPTALIFLLTMAVAALLLGFRGPPDIGRISPGNAVLTRVTRNSRTLLSVAAIFGLTAGATAFVQGCVLPGTDCRPDELVELRGVDAAVGVLLVIIPLIVAIRFWGHSRKLFIFGLVAALALGYLLVVDPSLGTFAPRSYLRALPLARTVIFVAPVVAIGRSVLGAYRQGASSRKVGVLWDVVSFWPRWYHPLAPPAYGPKVVTTLKEHVAAGEVEVLAGHSQGSVIAAIATHQAILEEQGNVHGLLTYGSPLAMLYSELFPGVGIAELMEELPGRLAKGWVNLWRDDDPVGGKSLGGSVDNWIAAGSGHFAYELAPAYRRARDDLA